MSIRWTLRARRDLQAIGRYIARDDLEAARRWVSRLVECAEGAAAIPKAGRLVPEVGRDDTREVFLRTYRVVYRIRKGGIDVLTVAEGHQLLRL